MKKRRQVRKENSHKNIILDRKNVYEKLFVTGFQEEKGQAELKEKEHIGRARRKST